MLRIESLEAVVPGLKELRPEGPRQVDIESIDRLLGVRLPSDYREFILAYPAIELDEFLRVYAPVPGLEEGFVEEIHEELEILGDLYESGDDLSGGYAPYPAEGGLLPWGASLSGDTFFWKVATGDGDRWPVVVGGRNGDWWEFDGGVIAFLVGLIDGTIERHGLPRDVPSATPRVHVFAD